jgi:D-lyxose ketol-isomerase
MKRSEINRIMQSADEFIRACKFYLPPFAYWTPEDWQTKGPEAAEIVENKLGWDITDFGRGDFSRYGLFLFTLRNGHPSNWEKRSGKLYAEKILITQPGQETPMHFHWRKMEDIINRGGGTMRIQLYNATSDEQLDEIHDVVVSTDGVQRRLKAGTVLDLHPGESITLPQYCYHRFWCEDEPVMMGEVSLVNDDDTDNRFAEPTGRFPTIEEDEAPLHLLVSDYEKYVSLHPSA